MATSYVTGSDMDLCIFVTDVGYEDGMRLVWVDTNKLQRLAYVDHSH